MRGWPLTSEEEEVRFGAAGEGEREGRMSQRLCNALPPPPPPGKSQAHPSNAQSEKGIPWKWPLRWWQHEWFLFWSLNAPRAVGTTVSIRCPPLTTGQPGGTGCFLSRMKEEGRDRGGASALGAEQGGPKRSRNGRRFRVGPGFTVIWNHDFSCCQLPLQKKRGGWPCPLSSQRWARSARGTRPLSTCHLLRDIAPVQLETDVWPPAPTILNSQVTYPLSFLFDSITVIFGDGFLILCNGKSANEEWLCVSQVLGATDGEGERERRKKRRGEREREKSSFSVLQNIWILSPKCH